MTVIYVDQTGQLGGGELSLYDWLKSSPAGAEVLLFENGPFRTMIEALGIPVTVLQASALKGLHREAGLRSALGFVPAVLRLRRALRSALAHGSVLYANSQKAFILAALSKRAKQPLIWHLRDILTPEHFSSSLRRIVVFLANRFATLVLVNSQATADAFIAEGGNASRVRLVPDGIDPESFAGIPSAEVETVRAGICPEEIFLAGHFGRLSEWKGQHVLLEAMAALPAFHVCFVGDALFGETAYAERLKERAAQPDLAGRVHFLGFRKDVPTLMLAMDVIVHASIAAEPLGRVIIEGMFAGRPVIATRAGGAAEIAQDGQSGLLCTPGSAEELAAALQRVQASPELTNHLVAGGRKRAHTVYSLAEMVKNTQAALDEVARQKLK